MQIIFVAVKQSTLWVFVEEQCLYRSQINFWMEILRFLFFIF